MLAQTLRLTFDGNGAISIPGFIADAANAGFVTERSVIPVRMLQTNPSLLEPFTLKVITPMTREMAASSNVQKLVGTA